MSPIATASLCALTTSKKAVRVNDEQEGTQSQKSCNLNELRVVKERFVQVRSDLHHDVVYSLVFEDGVGIVEPPHGELACNGYPSTSSTHTLVHRNGRKKRDGEGRRWRVIYTITPRTICSLGDVVECMVSWPLRLVGYTCTSKRDASSGARQGRQNNSTSEHHDKSRVFEFCRQR